MARYAVKTNHRHHDPADKRERDLVDHILMCPHPFIVQLFGAYYFDQRANSSIIMEYCEGGDLHRRIESLAAVAGARKWARVKSQIRLERHFEREFAGWTDQPTAEPPGQAPTDPPLSRQTDRSRDRPTARPSDHLTARRCVQQTASPATERPTTQGQPAATARRGRILAPLSDPSDRPPRPAATTRLEDGYLPPPLEGSVVHRPGIPCRGASRRAGSGSPRLAVLVRGGGVGTLHGAVVFGR